MIRVEDCAQSNGATLKLGKNVRKLVEEAAVEAMETFKRNTNAEVKQSKQIVSELKEVVKQNGAKLN